MYINAAVLSRFRNSFSIFKYRNGIINWFLLPFANDSYYFPYFCGVLDGWGSLSVVQAGQFVIEYCGEVITWTEARRRSHAYELQGRNKLMQYSQCRLLYFISILKPLIFLWLITGIKDAYIICLNASECIDATAKGSHARFINHSW